VCDKEDWRIIAHRNWKRTNQGMWICMIIGFTLAFLIVGQASTLDGNAGAAIVIFLGFIIWSILFKIFEWLFIKE
jgi:hypothetical protein